jgi:hypothetical protein
LPDRDEPISTALTLEEFKRAFDVRPTDAVCPCHCGSCDCPGWKIVSDADRALGEAYERLPEILSQAAYDVGRKMAEEFNRRFWEAFTGQHVRRRIRIPAGTAIYLTPDGLATTQPTGCKIGDLNNPVEFDERVQH